MLKGNLAHLQCGEDGLLPCVSLVDLCGDPVFNSEAQGLQYNYLWTLGPCLVMSNIYRVYCTVWEIFWKGKGREMLTSSSFTKWSVIISASPLEAPLLFLQIRWKSFLRQASLLLCTDSSSQFTWLFLHSFSQQSEYSNWARSACFHLCSVRESSSEMFREQVTQLERKHEQPPVPENSTGRIWATEAVKAISRHST